MELQTFSFGRLFPGKNQKSKFKLITWIGVKHPFNGGDNSVKDMLDPQRISDIFCFDTEKEVKPSHSVDFATNQAHS